jgi:hypothetical protein
VTSEPPAGTSAKGRNEPLVWNLPQVKSRAYPMGVSCTDTPLQGASKTGKPTVEEGPASKALSRCARQKLK